MTSEQTMKAIETSTNVSLNNERRKTLCYKLSVKQARILLPFPKTTKILNNGGLKADNLKTNMT